MILKSPLRGCSLAPLLPWFAACQVQQAADLRAFLAPTPVWLREDRESSASTSDWLQFSVLSEMQTVVNLNWMGFFFNLANFIYYSLKLVCFDKPQL